MTHTNATVKGSPRDRFSDLRQDSLSDVEKASIVRLAFDILAARHAPGRLLSNPQDTRRYLQLALERHKNEVFGVIFLDSRHRVLVFDELFFGTINGIPVYPRVVAQRALELNAAAVILTHNHPSGVAEPSRADEVLTRQLKDALALVEVQVLDHIIVTNVETTSFAERGLL